MSLKIDAEVKLDSEPCVLAFDNSVFVGLEDGSIKTFDTKLTPVASWPAHAVQIFTIAAADGKVYSSSNDGGIRIWSAKGEKITELPYSPEGDVIVLNVFGSDLYTGDEAGNVCVYSGETLKAKYNVLEEVKDLQLRVPYLFTVRDLYVTVTEIKPEESKTRFVTRHSMEGKAPIRVVGDKLLLMTRGGNNMKLHFATAEGEFKQLHEVKVSDMIVTSLTVVNNTAWTGGWDGIVKRWNINNDKIEPAGEISLGACINALVADSECVYAAVTGGKLVRISAT